MLSIFLVANLFAARAVMRSLGGSKKKITELKSELAENRMWLEEKDLWERRRAWLDENLPASLVRQRISVGNAQGDLMQTLQNDVLGRRLRIERQTLVEPQANAFYDEVAVSFRVEGDAAEVNRWLATLQSPELFQVVKTFKLELDGRSREVEPQAECDITVARWFAPSAGDSPAPIEDAAPPSAPADDSSPNPENSPDEKAPEDDSGKLELTERS
ncbi:MAG: hypothetical protein KDN19_06945 [Verrucomicrobiae bacterium]|nr:hypothetical protein [Verrucomicrobiae bacterium]